MALSMHSYKKIRNDSLKCNSRWAAPGNGSVYSRVMVTKVLAIRESPPGINTLHEHPASVGSFWSVRRKSESYSKIFVDKLVGKIQSTAMRTDLLHSGVNRCGVDV